MCSFQLTFVSFFRDAVLENYFKGIWNFRPHIKILSRPGKSSWLQGFIKQFQTVPDPKTLKCQTTFAFCSTLRSQKIPIQALKILVIGHYNKMGPQP